jgi:hypothetical protein
MAVYSYGSGETYATPQAAFDACQAANESGGAAAAFTEANYIRAGVAAVHENAAVGEPVLRLAHSVSGRGVLPTQAFPLVIDEAAGVDAILADTNGSNVIVGSAADGSAAASHVIIDGPQLISESASGILTRAASGAVARDWRVIGTIIEAAVHGISFGDLAGMLLDAAKIIVHGADGAAVHQDQADLGLFYGMLALRNCPMISGGYGVQLAGGDAEATENRASIISIHNSIYSRLEALKVVQPCGDYADLTLLNTILQATDDAAYAMLLDYLNEPRLQLGEANVFWGPAGVASINATIHTLATLRSQFGGDAYSLNIDPSYSNPSAGDLTLLSTSRALLRGRAAAPLGYAGGDRAVSIDPGAYQRSAGGAWDISVENGELAASITGRVPVTGL